MGICALIFTVLTFGLIFVPLPREEGSYRAYLLITMPSVFLCAIGMACALSRGRWLILTIFCLIGCEFVALAILLLTALAGAVETKLAAPNVIEAVILLLVVLCMGRLVLALFVAGEDLRVTLEPQRGFAIITAVPAEKPVPVVPVQPLTPSDPSPR